MGFMIKITVDTSSWFIVSLLNCLLFDSKILVMTKYLKCVYGLCTIHTFKQNTKELWKKKQWLSNFIS